MYNQRWKDRRNRRTTKHAARRSERHATKILIRRSLWEMIHTPRMQGVTYYGDPRINL